MSRGNSKSGTTKQRGRKRHKHKKAPHGRERRAIAKNSGGKVQPAT